MSTKYDYKVLVFDVFVKKPVCRVPCGVGHHGTTAHGSLDEKNDAACRKISGHASANQLFFLH